MREAGGMKGKKGMNGGTKMGGMICEKGEETNNNDKKEDAEKIRGRFEGETRQKKITREGEREGRKGETGRLWEREGDTGRYREMERGRGREREVQYIYNNEWRTIL